MKKIIFLASCYFATAVFAADPATTDCYFTVVKSNCWYNYDVQVSVVSSISNASLTKVSIPKGKQWERIQFTCTLGDIISYTAEYSPPIWKGDEGKPYQSKSLWKLPSALQADQKALSIQICYPEQFLNLPIPPDASSNCECDTSMVTPIDLKSS